MEPQPLQSIQSINHQPANNQSSSQKQMNIGFLGMFSAGGIASWFASLKVQDWAIKYFNEKPNPDIYQTHDYTGGWEALKGNVKRSLARLADFSMIKSSAASWAALGAGVLASLYTAKMLFQKESEIKLPIGSEALPNYAAMPAVPAVPSSLPAANDPVIVNRVSHQGKVVEQQKAEELIALRSPA
jgi:hypothetical protein